MFVLSMELESSSATLSQLTSEHLNGKCTNMENAHNYVKQSYGKFKRSYNSAQFLLPFVVEFDKQNLTNKLKSISRVSSITS